VVVALVGSAAATACWSSPSDSTPNGGIGIKLLEAPVSRRDDPRANLYIIDHLAPGADIHRQVEIGNSSDSIQTVEIYAGAATVGDAKFAYSEGRTPNELTTWISFDHPKIDLPAHSTTPVMTTIAVPRSGTTGEQYAVIWAQISAPPTASHGLGMNNRVGIRVYLDVGPGGEPPSDFEIEKLTTARSSDGRPEFIAQVRNTGRRAVDISGSLTLSEGPGSLSAGPFDVTVGSTLAPGDSSPVSVLLNKQLPNGPWKASLTLKSGLIQKTVSATITFPDEAGKGGAVVLDSGWSLFTWASIALAALVVGAGGVVLRHRMKRRRALV
jgi:hypothetical protein